MAADTAYANTEESVLPNGSADTAFDSMLRKIAHVGDPTHAPLPQCGQLVGGKYRIEASLARGGMGAVFCATHNVSKKQVALKWMLRSTADQNARNRFQREALAAGRIDHPNVVDVYDVGEEGNCAYLVMELLHGEPLQTLLARGPLSAQDAIALLLPAMRGVCAAHRVGIIHRDLKPDNIFLCTGPDGAPREAKVLDFGISAVHGGFQTETLTEDGVILGTPAYMSPEQIDCGRAVDARTDVYAFGVILYQALTGRLPFAAQSYPRLVLSIMQEQPVDPSALRAEVPRTLSAIVLRAMAKRREDRFASVEALMEALTAFCMLQPTAAGAEAPHKRRTQLMSAFGCALALGLVGSLVGDRLALRSTQTPVQAPVPAAAAAVSELPSERPAATLASALSTVVTQSSSEPEAVSSDSDKRAATRRQRAPRAASPRHALYQPVSAPDIRSAQRPPRSGNIRIDDL